MGLLQQIGSIKNNVPLVYGAGKEDAMARISSVNVLASDWIGNTSPYSQRVTIDGITENSKIDLNPSVEQQDIFRKKDLTFVTENDGGIVTVFCFGQKPTRDYTMQITITEVIVNE